MFEEKQWSNSYSGGPVSPARYVHTEDAVFLGWQKTYRGNLVPLYCVTAEGHPSYGSTVTDRTLNKLKLRVPAKSAV
jgi:hypothetical protein